jgi:hypothetical protein
MPRFISILVAAVLVLGFWADSPVIGTAEAAEPYICAGPILPTVGKLRGGAAGFTPGQDMIVQNNCSINQPGVYKFGQINIIKNDTLPKPNNGGVLTITEPLQGTGTRIDIWASSIIVEKDGALIVGGAGAPYGRRGGVVNFYIYGRNQSVVSPTDSTPVDPLTKPGIGAICKSPLTSTTGPCGIPSVLWKDNGANVMCIGNPDIDVKNCTGIKDWFYQYGPLYGDEMCADASGQATKKWDNKVGCPTGSQVGYFGYKTVAVSYGGTLQLFGYKGTILGGSTETTCAKGSPDAIPTSTGCAWLRLAKDLPEAVAGTEQKPNQLILSAATGNRWVSPDDYKAQNGETPIPTEVVITTTDYLPGHNDDLTHVAGITDTTLSFTDPVNWPHNGTKYDVFTGLGSTPAARNGVKTRMVNAGMDATLIGTGVPGTGAETRAAVALLTRSIRFISAGDALDETFEQASKKSSNCHANPPVAAPAVGYCYSFGAHTVFRQGFARIQIQGVEFQYFGQGGKKAHYPLHFHMARQVPDKGLIQTYIKDSVINESMTRWIDVHSTQGVLFQRNIGFKSIGSGFFLEDATETDNKFYSNLGIFARAAIDNAQNPRMVPGILAAADKFLPNKNKDVLPLPANAFPQRSDYQFPAGFWIANGWNDFIGNMIAGVGACGTAYWFVAASNSDMPDVPTSANQEFGTHQHWSGFSALQKNGAYLGSTPLKSFYGNFATSSMNSFQTIGANAPCFGIDYWNAPEAGNKGHIRGVPSFAPTPMPGDRIEEDTYYPHTDANRQATMCPSDGKGGYNCTLFTSGALPKCDSGKQLQYCAVTVIDHFTTQFHWSEQNFAAMWFRPQWTLVTNSFISDVQASALTFVTSGDYARGSVIEGLWMVLRDSVLAGATQAKTQPNNGYSANGGPFLNGKAESLSCDNVTDITKEAPNFCSNAAEGISFQLSNFGVSQRMFSIYDGPAVQESNIYLDITPTPCSTCVYASLIGVRKRPTTTLDPDPCYLPNAAIAWKQPNGFFYPPTFHSSNLFFGNVKIRHYVVDALLKENTYYTNLSRETSDYCKVAANVSYGDYFIGFTDIDREVELSDDDGTLNGLTTDAKTETISLNPIEFFDGPLQTAQCLSNLGVTASKACPADGKDGPLPATDTPASANVTPYDYVTTVVFPACAVGSNKNDGACLAAVGDTPDPGNNRHLLKADGRGGAWSTKCSAEFCYGVPLYRQFLTGTGTVENKANATREAYRWFNNGCNDDWTTSKCRWPFVRMSGQGTYQRSSLTVNYGTYYLDTSVSQATQAMSSKEDFTPDLDCDDPRVTKDDFCAPHSVNVFEGPQNRYKGQGTYYMFFLFAKTSTRQTYQIYVGPNFNLDTVKVVRPFLKGLPFTRLQDDSNIPATWKSALTKNYNDNLACKGFFKPDGVTPDNNCGILQVTVNFKGLTEFDPTPTNGLCTPLTFCKATGDTCGCKFDATTARNLLPPNFVANPAASTLKQSMVQQCQSVCSTWAVADLDFPEKVDATNGPDEAQLGPLGFSWTMPADFKADDKGLAHRPPPQFFPTTAEANKPDFTTEFARTAIDPDKSGGDCFYSKRPALKQQAPNTCQMPKAPPNP